MRISNNFYSRPLHVLSATQSIATLRFAAAIKWSHRWQIIHDCAKPGVGLRLQAAVPGGGDKVVHVVISNDPQRPHEGFRLVEVTRPIVAPLHDIHGYILEPMSMVKDVIIVSV